MASNESAKTLTITYPKRGVSNYHPRPFDGSVGHSGSSVSLRKAEISLERHKIDMELLKVLLDNPYLQAVLAFLVIEAGQNLPNGYGGTLYGNVKADALELALGGLALARSGALKDMADAIGSVTKAIAPVALAGSL